MSRLDQATDRKTRRLTDSKTTVAAKPGAIVAGLVLIVIGGILAAVARRVDG